MEQNKRMLEDRDTNFVYLSEWLEKEHPEFFSELTTLFNNQGVQLTVPNSDGFSEYLGSFCNPVCGHVLGSPSINVLKFNIH